MRPHEIFASMSPEHADSFFGRLAKESPAMFSQAVHAAAIAMKSRPQFLFKQPMERRVSAVRRALARVSSGPIAEEILAVYFLECRKEVLVEWLDLIGLAHEDGALEEARPPSPPAAELEKHVAAYRSKDDDARPRAPAAGLRGAELRRLAGSGRSARAESSRTRPTRDRPGPSDVPRATESAAQRDGGIADDHLVALFRLRLDDDPVVLLPVRGQIRLTRDSRRRGSAPA